MENSLSSIYSSAVCSLALIVAGGAAFLQWRKAKRAEEGTKATLWLVISVIVTALGLASSLGTVIRLTDLLGAMLGG
jgi:hypothetical protein